MMKDGDFTYYERMDDLAVFSMFLNSHRGFMRERMGKYMKDLPLILKYRKEIIDQNLFRKDIWRASHLRSFKHGLWKNLIHDDLKDEKGDFYKMTYDQAIMLPLLEMAGHKCTFIDDILHVYNKENPLNIDKNKAQEQYDLAQKIRSKKPYSRL